MNTKNKPMNTKTETVSRIANRASRIGSTAKTTKGQHRAIMAYCKKLQAIYARGILHSWMGKPARPTYSGGIPSAYHADKELRAAKGLYTHRRNWNLAIPVEDGGVVQINDHGAYSRSCSYHHITYTPTYTSWAVIDPKRNIVTYTTAERKVTRKAPKGCHFRFDRLGLAVIRNSDGMDYHVLAEDLSARNFVSRVRKGLVENRKWRLQVAREKREDAKLMKNYEAHQAKVREILPRIHRRSDILRLSAAAGNCEAGTRRFLEDIGATRTKGKIGAFYRLARLKGRANDPRFQAVCDLVGRRYV